MIESQCVNWPELEGLAQELKSLIGHGATAHRVLTRPILLAMVWAKYPELELAALKLAVLDELIKATDGFPAHEAESLKELLKLGRRFNFNAPIRRENVIVRMRWTCSVEVLRRAEGLEMDLMRELAKVLSDNLQ
jgi:hypothetical protein